MNLTLQSQGTKFNPQVASPGNLVPLLYSSRETNTAPSPQFDDARHGLRSRNQQPTQHGLIENRGKQESAKIVD